MEQIAFAPSFIWCRHPWVCHMTRSEVMVIEAWKLRKWRPISKSISSANMHVIKWLMVNYDTPTKTISKFKRTDFDIRPHLASRELQTYSVSTIRPFVPCLHIRLLYISVWPKTTWCKSAIASSKHFKTNRSLEFANNETSRLSLQDNLTLQRHNKTTASGSTFFWYFTYKIQ